ncbi:putative pre-mRNA-splicing factor ATP-dependent RNA helicase DEAH9 isoform X2 [Capsicum chacoense]
MEQLLPSTYYYAPFKLFIRSLSMQNMLPEYITLNVVESILFAGKAVRVLRNPSPGFQFKDGSSHQQTQRGSQNSQGCTTTISFQNNSLNSTLIGEDLLPQAEADKIESMLQDLKSFLEESRQLMCLPPRQSTVEADLMVPFQLAALKTIGEEDKYFSRVSLRMPSFGITLKPSPVDLSKVKVNKDGDSMGHPVASLEVSLDGWDGISLEYSIDWPLQLFITQEVLSKIFQYLLHLKRTQMELEKSWAFAMHQDHIDFAKLRNDSRKSSVSQHRRQRLRPMWDVREHMAFLIRNLQFYIQVDVIESQWNLWAFIKRYLAALISQSFLDIGSVSRILDGIMKLCLQFCWKIENDESNRTTSELEHIAEVRRRHEQEQGPIKEPAILSFEGTNGNILVFLTGQDDIDAAIQLLTEEAQSSGKQGLVTVPLYSGLPRADQDLVFSPTPRGKRKVIFSTNIAETSLTLEGIVYVVDSGFSKQRFYNPISDIENLVVAPISKASARQRAGRAGRVRPGKCFRLYTEDYYSKEMSVVEIPEIQRSNLVSCVIQLKALGIDNILGFDWPASPSAESMIRALEVLYSLGVLDDDAKLTSPTGFQVAEIPLFGCSEEIITIAAALSIQSIWIPVRGVQKQLDEAKLKFAALQLPRFLGDHVTFLNVYKGFIQSNKSSKWCHKNFINYHAMGSPNPTFRKVIEVREQLKRITQRLGIGLKSCQGDIQAVRKAITAGVFANAARLEPFSHNGMYKTVRTSQEVYIHPSSVLFRVNPKFIVYHSLVSTDRQYMRNVITIDPSWLTEAAPHFYQKQAA